MLYPLRWLKSILKVTRTTIFRRFFLISQSLRCIVWNDLTGSRVCCLTFFYFKNINNKKRRIKKKLQAAPTPSTRIRTWSQLETKMFWCKKKSAENRRSLMKMYLYMINRNIHKMIDYNIILILSNILDYNFKHLKSRVIAARYACWKW